MNSDELIEITNSLTYRKSRTLEHPYTALRAVLELCKDWQSLGATSVPLKDIIQAIEKELK